MLKKCLCIVAALVLASTAHAGTGFRVDKTFTDQTGFTANAYTLLQWPAEAFDQGAKFLNNGWIPSASGEGQKIVCFSGQIWVRQNGYGNPPNYVAKIIKNGYPGTQIIAGIGTYGTFPNSFVIPISGCDLASEGDEYKIYLFATDSTAVVDGHPAHTWWSGVVVQ